MSMTSTKVTDITEQKSSSSNAMICAYKSAMSEMHWEIYFLSIYFGQWKTCFTFVKNSSLRSFHQNRLYNWKELITPRLAVGEDKWNPSESSMQTFLGPWGLIRPLWVMIWGLTKAVLGLVSHSIYYSIY